MIQETRQHMLERAQQLAPADQRWLVVQLREAIERTVPDHASIDEAVEWYLADAVSLARAAELAGVTRGELLDVRAARGATQHPVDFRSTTEMDAIAERLVVRRS